MWRSRYTGLEPVRRPRYRVRLRPVRTRRLSSWRATRRRGRCPSSSEQHRTPVLSFLAYDLAWTLGLRVMTHSKGTRAVFGRHRLNYELRLCEICSYKPPLTQANHHVGCPCPIGVPRQSDSLAPQSVCAHQDAQRTSVLAYSEAPRMRFV